MIRVALPAIGGRHWPAGRIYLWNLLFAISSLSKKEIQPVVVHGHDFDARELEGASAELFHNRGAFGSERIRLAGRVCKYVLGHDLVLEAALRAAHADIFSHGPPLGRRSRVRQVAWIPDLQHRHLPHLFSPLERLGRDLSFREAVRDATNVIVSSEAALRDLTDLAGPEAERKGRVLRFVTQPRLIADTVAEAEVIRDRYGLPSRFFHLPNQFWRHKNHSIVIDALRLAVHSEPEVTVIATGAGEDYRDREYYPQLMKAIAASNLSDRFRHLGTVPFTDLMALMKHSIGVINPSRFEGWSTTVEEAKSLGKVVLLSDIAVHREQAPPRGRYFGVDDPNTLAGLLVDAWANASPEHDRAAALEAATSLGERTRKFGEAYERIIVEAVSG